MLFRQFFHTVLVIALLGLTQPNYAQTRNQCVVLKQKCKLRLKQTKFGFQLDSLEFSTGPIKKAGQIKIGDDLIQQMTAIAQILDQMQLSRCQLIQALPPCDPNIGKIIYLQAYSSEMLGYLAITAQATSGDPAKLSDAIIKWLAAAANMIQRIYEKQLMAADPTITQTLKVSGSALEYAARKLNLSPTSTEFIRIAEQRPYSNLLQ
jgi:hypothetical protein